MKNKQAKLMGLAVGAVLGIELATGGAAVAEAGETSAAWCERQWASESADFAIRKDYETLLDRWRKYSDKCKGTVSYEARLSMIYSFSGRLSDARSVLLGIDAQKSEYVQLVDLALLLVESMELASQGKLDHPQLKKQERLYANHVRKYPGYLEAYVQLGNIQTLLGEHAAAISTLESIAEAAAASGAQNYSVFSNLTVNYAAEQQYEKAHRMANVALEMNGALTGDKFFMCALARVQAAKGMFQEAQNTLRLIALKTPHIKSDPEFLAAVDFVFERMEAAKGNRQES